MDYVIRRASTFSNEEQAAMGITGIPQDWPVQSYLYVDSVPNGFEQISEEDLNTLKVNNQAAYDAWVNSLRPIFQKSKTLEVITQFEKRDKTLKLAHIEATVGEDGIAIGYLKIPGTPGTDDGRWISAGTAFFDVVTPGDKILGVYFTDEDNILGNGAGSVIGSYTDDEAGDNKGWVISARGFLEVEAIGGYGFAPAGFYLKVIGKKGSGVTTGTMYVNIEWGKVE